MISLFLFNIGSLKFQFFIPLPLPPLSNRCSDDAVIKRVLLGVVCPVGWGHAAVRVQQDSEAAHDEQRQEDEEQQHEDEGRLLLQRQVGRHMVAAAWRRERAAEEPLGHPGHVHAWASGLQRFVGVLHRS